MDPLTHTLVGANLAATRLGEKTRFAAAALVIGANLPDIDALLYVGNHSDLALELRRGWTHGILALFVLPFVQTLLLMLLARVWKGKEAPPLRPGWLLALSTLAIWTHPTLDWLNTYGMRWLMPFDGTWFYGDSVYIMDPWLWLVLGAGYLAGRRPTFVTVGAWLFFTLAIVRVVFRRSPEYLIVIAIVAIVLLAVLLWRPARLASHRFATGAVVVAAVYICTRLLIHSVTVREVESRLPLVGVAPVERLMVAPNPLDPTRWSFVAQSGADYRFGDYRWRGRTMKLDAERMPVARDTPEYRAAIDDPSVRGFANWVRFPSYRVEKRGSETVVQLYDARRRGGSSRTVVLKR